MFHVDGVAGQALKWAEIVDNYLLLGWADGRSQALDVLGQQLVPGYAIPASVNDAEQLPGDLLLDNSAPTTLALNAEGTTLAIGFSDGGVVEVDFAANERGIVVSHSVMADHMPISSLAWISDETDLLIGTSAGMQWTRASCAGCALHEKFGSVIRGRVWVCYVAADIADMGSIARREFDLKDCPPSPSAEN